jgi:hypothetical protein
MTIPPLSLALFALALVLSLIAGILHMQRQQWVRDEAHMPRPERPTATGSRLGRFQARWRDTQAKARVLAEIEAVALNAQIHSQREKREQHHHE